MGVRWDMIDGKPGLRQDPGRPAVYLDQWMWGLLSENNELRNTFIEIGAKKHAMVLYSLVSFLELVKIEDAAQIQRITEVMDALDFGFTRCDPSRVIELEKERETPEGSVFYDGHPIVDTDLLRILAIASDPLKTLKVSSILTSLKDEGSEGLKRSAAEIGVHADASIERARQEEEVLQRSKRRNKTKAQFRKKPPFTSDILRWAVDFIVSNGTMKMGSNEWIDFFHAIVPISYLDFVLIDKRWSSFVRNNCPLKPPQIAKANLCGGWIGKTSLTVADALLPMQTSTTCLKIADFNRMITV